MAIDSVFGHNASSHYCKVLENLTVKKVVHLPHLDDIVKEYSALIAIIQIPKDFDKCPHLLAHVTDDMRNKGVIAYSNRGPT